jgi:hypothetical protein
MYTLLADLVALLHAAFVAFVVVGQALILIGWTAGWSWTRMAAFRWLHVTAIGFVVLEAWTGADCPLTLLESHWRQRAGWGGYPSSFVGYWLHRLLYYRAPEWVFTLSYSGFAALVVLTFVLYPPRRS